MAHITIASLSSPIYEVSAKYIKTIDQFEPEELFGRVKIIINGAWVGVVDDPMAYFKYMKNMKYKGIINIYTSIVFDYKIRRQYLH